MIGDEKYTFIEGVKDPRACTLLVKGPNEHTIAQLKDAVRPRHFRGVESS